MSALAIVIRVLTDDDSVSAPAYPIVAPAGSTLPNIVVSMIHEDQDVVLAGQREGYEAGVSIACHDATAGAADRLGEAVKSALGSIIEQTINDSTSTAFAVATIWKDGTDLTDYADDLSVFRRVIDFAVRWRPAP